MKKIIALVLTLTLAFSLAIPALAEDSVPQYTNYVSLGDSIPAGTGIKGYRTGVIEWTEGTYPALVRDAVGADPDMDASFPGAHCGMRVREMLIGLTHDLSYADSYTYDFFNTNAWARPGALDTMMTTPYAEAVERADLITIEFGSNELMGVLVFQLQELLESLSAESEYAGAFDSAIEQAKGMGVTAEAAAVLLNALKTVFNTEEQLKAVLATLYDAVINNGVYQFSNTWDEMMGIILDLNSEADIVVIGIYNPVANFVGGMLGEGVLTDIVTEFAQKVIDALNYTMEYGSAYRDKYVFADTCAMSEVITEGHTSDGSHPDAYGHVAMKDIVLNALGKFCKHQHTVRLFEKKATLFEKGYTGDLVCSDCGVLLEQGTIINVLGKKTEIPKGAAYAAVESVAKTAVKVVSSVLGKLTK